MSVIEELERIENERIQGIKGQIDAEISAKIEEVMRILRNPDPQLDEPIIMDIKVKIPEMPKDKVEYGEYFDATVIYSWELFNEMLKNRPLPQTPQLILTMKQLGKYECAGKVISDIRVTTKRRMQIKQLLGLEEEGDFYVEEGKERESNEPRNDIEKIEVEALKGEIGIIKNSDKSELDEKGIFSFLDEHYKRIEVEMTLREVLIGFPKQNGKNFKSYSQMQEEQRKADKSPNRITLSSIGRTVKNWLRRGER